MRSPVLAATAALAGAMLASPSVPQPLVRAPASSSARQEMLVTNQNLALIAETRRVELPAGAVELLWESAPASTRTETWSLTAPREVRWTGLAASPAHAGDEQWLRSLVGRRVRVVRPGGASVDAEVVDVHGPTPDLVLFREGADLVYGEPRAAIVAPGEGERARRPAGVVLRLSVEKAGTRELLSRYLVSGLTWQADYGLTLARDERSARLDGWFTVDNGSGSDFSPDRLRLLAGVLRTAVAPPTPRSAMMAAAPAEAGVAESAATSESRVYEVASPGPLRAGRTTFPLAGAARVSVAKTYVVRGSFWSGRSAEAATVPVAVRYRVGAAPLGRALPAGVVRVYTEDGAFFAGEDRVANTPEGTDFEIEISEAFDLSARRQQTSFAQTGPRESEAAFEVTVTSRKSQEATVLVREELPGDWTILESSRPVTRRGASTAEFALPVASGATSKLTYRVRVRT